jgi:hypothetical protein
LFLYIPGLAGYKGLVNRFVLTGVDNAVVVTSGNGGEDVVVTSLVFCEGGLGGASAGSGHTIPGLCGTQTFEFESKTVSPAHVLTFEALCSHWKYLLHSIG